ncbi:MAG TPA: alkaline phosphatase D family protein, partial [Acidimicrobiales bacterium]|nr:alkaline phosphatase D family protein [Acidimicrobiales bacterium]
GDAHATFACDLRQDAGNEDSPVVAAEVCGTSITSQGRPASQIETLLRENPDIHYADAGRRGYTVLDITPGETQVVARVIDDATVRTTGVSTARTFTIERDRPGIQL